MLLIQAQDLADVPLELRHLIAIALTAKATEAVDILTDLGGGQMHALTQLLGGDGCDARSLQFAQMTIVAGQTADHRIRNMTSHGKALLITRKSVGIEPIYYTTFVKGWQGIFMRQRR